MYAGMRYCNVMYYIPVIRREPNGGLVNGGLVIYDFSLKIVSSLVSTCFVHVEAFLGYCLLSAAAPLMPHMSHHICP